VVACGGVRSCNNCGVSYEKENIGGVREESNRERERKKRKNTRIDIRCLYCVSFFVLLSLLFQTCIFGYENFSLISQIYFGFF